MRWLVLGVLGLAAAAEGGQRTSESASNGSDRASALPFAFDGPAPPVPPEVVTRDDEGRVTVRAVRIPSSLRIDGRLDEPLYIDVPSISDFIQVEPRAGSPATEKTEFWVTFDADHVYVSFRCWESRPDRIVANEMRRDNVTAIAGGDYVNFVFDTFYDRRNGIDFAVNPIGGRIDGQVTNERQYSADWNPIWDVAVGRFDGGWTVEAAVPFKSLRYRPGRAQIWGFNVQRFNPSKNELSTLTRIPAALGSRASMQFSLAATLVGLEAPPGSKNLEIKPYLVSDLSTDATTTPRMSNDVSGDVGVDVKYGVTQNLTADLTYNTDFAQVEADEQQVNLTRFSLFFPEKREFFLENQGTFSFGGATTGLGASASDTPILFYSRRIGLNDGRVVPIRGGGRLTGRVGRTSVGALNIQTGNAPLAGAAATNFSVLRLKRDILRRSSVGVIYTGRSGSPTGPGRNQAVGLDGTFAFFDNLAINTYWARTDTPGLAGKDTSHRVQLDYAGDLYGVQLERLHVGDHFNPDAGFVRRDDMRRHFGQLRFSPRPRGIRAIRKFVWLASTAHIQNGAGQVETRDSDGEFGIQLQNGDQFTLAYGHSYELLPEPFQIGPGVTLPPGGYEFGGMRAAYNFGRNRQRASGNLVLEHGGFFSGRKTTVNASRGRLALRPQLSVEPTISLNWVDLAEGAFTTSLVGLRTTYSTTPKMFTSALLQYNSGSNSVSANVRFRWEYRPGSELFVVYNEQRDTSVRSFPGLSNRALIVKVNRLFRF
jgi:hypothetical protein